MTDTTHTFSLELSTRPSSVKVRQDPAMPSIWDSIPAPVEDGEGGKKKSLTERIRSYCL